MPEKLKNLPLPPVTSIDNPEPGIDDELVRRYLTDINEAWEDGRCVVVLQLVRFVIGYVCGLHLCDRVSAQDYEAFRDRMLLVEANAQAKLKGAIDDVSRG